MLIGRAEAAPERDLRRLVDHTKLSLVPALAAHGLVWCDEPPPLVPAPGFRDAGEVGVAELAALLAALRRWEAR
ncbi:hypothetical protein GL263_21575 [Streptomyces durbertensis]|uniref:Uncharacterized protein n=1 Tax=Streptomyces durbertensis TaxID=2448886 RepID=A0ABR6ELC3_9ACTN|nr:hypothetical protein [Streptomyces durbertensis]MBB1246124.1 hypothetical protein [Streptomyces durbertensis]